MQYTKSFVNYKPILIFEYQSMTVDIKLATMITLTKSHGLGVYEFSNGNFLTVGQDYNKEMFAGILFGDNQSMIALAEHDYKNPSDALSLFNIERTEMAVTEFAD